MANSGVSETVSTPRPFSSQRPLTRYTHTHTHRETMEVGCAFLPVSTERKDVLAPRTQSTRYNSATSPTRRGLDLEPVAGCGGEGWRIEARCRR